MGRKLHVGNLPYQVGETELQELFARAGSVESVTVMRDQATGRARGFAFVEMGTDEEAQTAIRELNATDVGGRNLSFIRIRDGRKVFFHRSDVREGVSFGGFAVDQTVTFELFEDPISGLRALQVQRRRPRT